MSFKHFFKTHFTETEAEALNESRWWGKFKEDKVSILEYDDVDANGKKKKKKFKVCKLDEDGSGPAYVIEARGGCRYGLFRATEGNFHMLRMTPKAKILKKPKGKFQEVDGKLVFELFHLAGKSQKLGGGKDAIAQAVQRKKKAPADWANQTLGPATPRVRQGDGMNTPAAKPEPKFDPNATLGEEEQLSVPFSDISAVAQEIADRHENNDLPGYDAKYTDNHIYNVLPDEYHDPKVMAQIHKEVEELLGRLNERRANVEPDKSFPNGEPTFDKNTDEWNKGVYTDAKA